ncbi:MAG: hypothetical protein RLZZ488_2584 [Pseudomonadota bacterium]|jgi:A/G-specific adenine glycosylase
MFIEDSHLADHPNWVNVLLAWYDQHKRDFPWRRKIDVYHTWICEVMSQQTTMAVVVPRFERFVATLPDVTSLADCSEDLLRELWSGLGYYARARNLRNGARYIVTERGGHFPANYEQWLTVPGVGPYTASVIASICAREAKACVDGNVIRVVARLAGFSSTEVWSELGKKSIQGIADRFIDHDRPGDFNQAMMELGATLCQKQSPGCGRCPIKTVCRASQLGIVAQCPPNKPRKQTEFVELDALRVSSPAAGGNEQYLLVARKRGFLSETVGFPLFPETDRSSLHTWLKENVHVRSVQISSEEPSHTITNHRISVRVVDVELFEGADLSSEFVRHFSQRFAESVTDCRWVSKSLTKKTVASSLDRKIWENIALF